MKRFNKGNPLAGEVIYLILELIALGLIIWLAPADIASNEDLVSQYRSLLIFVVLIAIIV